MTAPDTFSVFDDGWSDPAAPGELHPRLRGEGGVAIARWLTERSVAPAELVDLATVLEAYASGWARDVDPSRVIGVLRGAVGQPGTVSSPALAILLREALARVNDTADLALLLAFLRRTALVQTLQAGSGPIG
ncbi:MAG TPA: hypothetical protein VFJ16_01845 [Longimicrobium sp.]|nr:hypothetical protein [Longimicrobium sp.]